MKLQGIAKLARTGDAFRKVIQTGRRLQIGVMSLRRNEVTGETNHPHSDRFLFVLHGDAEALAGARFHDLDKGDGLFVPAGTRVNVRNTGDDELQFLEIFSPPVFPEGFVEPTRARLRTAEPDEPDEPDARAKARPAQSGTAVKRPKRPALGATHDPPEHDPAAKVEHGHPDADAAKKHKPE
jgi:mannose-6-phosphate isomerase-like protein (cupin superfamily)